MGEQGATRSWEQGPAESRVLRVLFYLGEGLIGGAGLYLGTLVVWSRPWGGLSEVSLLFLLFLLLVYGSIRISLFSVMIQSSEAKANSPEYYEWANTRQWRVTALSSIVIAGALLGATRLQADARGVVPNTNILFFMTFALGLLLFGLALILTLTSQTSRTAE